MLLPLGLEEARVHRVPWISLAIAATCVAAYVLTWALPEEPMGEAEIRPVIEWWSEHPYLDVPPALRGILDERRVRAAFATEAAGVQRPSADVVVEEQAQLDTLAEEAMARVDAAPMRRFGVVPARGAAQVGWITHLFLHFGLLHLLGNLFFFYLVGPVLEDTWGRPVFTVFYLVGGVVAAVAQVLPGMDGRSVLAGASGAVATCMGAFAVRFARRRVRIFYWFLWRWYGTFSVAAWVWLGFWFLDELASLWLWGSSTGVAFMAHVGGFAFGAAVAGTLRASGVEARWLAPAVEATYTWAASEALEQARAAVARGDRPAALAALTASLSTRPDDPDVLLELARLELEAGHASGPARVEALLAIHLRRGDDVAVRNVIEELGDRLDPRRLRPTIAYRAAAAFEGGPEGLRGLAARLHAAAAEGGGTLGARARVRAAELCLAAGDAQGARDHLAALRASPGVPPDLLARGERVFAALPAPAPAAEPLSLELGHVAPRVLFCHVRSMEPGHLGLRASDGRDLSLPLVRIKAIAPALLERVTTARGVQHHVPVVDLVLDWGGAGKPATAVRIPGAGLAHGGQPAAALAGFVRRLADETGATLVPDRSVLGRLADHPDVAAFEASVYG